MTTTNQQVMEALVAKRRAYERVARFITSLARESSELGEEARGLEYDLTLLRPWVH
jgi:hypothetical protein